MSRDKKIKELEKEVEKLSSNKIDFSGLYENLPEGM